MGHVLMENRHGLAVDATLTQASGTAERTATLAMLDRRKTRHRITLGADKAYDVEAFVGDLRLRGVTPASQSPDVLGAAKTLAGITRAGLVGRPRARKKHTAASTP